MREKNRYRHTLIPAVSALILAFFIGMMVSASPACAAQEVQVSTEAELVLALAGASTDPAAPTHIVLTCSVEMPAGTPAFLPEGTYAVLEGASEGIKLTPSADWSVMRDAPSADHVPALLETAGTLTVKNLTIDASAADKGVRCIGVTSSGKLELLQTVVTGSKLTRVGGIGIYTLGDVVMGDGAAVENISVSVPLDHAPEGIGVHVGYDRITKAQGSLTMKSGSAVRSNSSTKKNNGARVDGIGIFARGDLTMYDGAKVSGNKSAYSGSGVGIHVEGVVGYPVVFAMHGGEISGNCENGLKQGMYGASGGGIGIYNNAVFLMEGGTVKENMARRGGGGLNMTGTINCRAELSGGAIENNRAYASGAGICVASAAAELTVKGSAKIRNNTNQFDSKEADKNGLVNSNGYHDNNGGGVYNAGTFVMEGGEITGNTAATDRTEDETQVYGQGGGVFNAGLMEMRGGNIAANSAASAGAGGNKAGSGGGIAIMGGDTPGELHLIGGTVRNNTAGGVGADVWLNGDNSSYSVYANVKTLEYTPNPGILYLGEKTLASSNLVIGDLVLPPEVPAFLSGTLEGSDITLTAVNAGKGSVAAESDGEYTVRISDARVLKDASGKKVYTLSKGNIVLDEERTSAYQDLSNASVAAIADQTYTGEEICPEPAVTLSGKTLVKDRDYQIVYSGNIDAGQAQAVVLGIGSYDGRVTKSFAIRPRDLSDGQIEPVRDRLYTGNPVTPALTVRAGGAVLTGGADYTAVCSDNTEAGTASVTVSGCGNYTGSLSGQFKIISRDGQKTAENAGELAERIVEAAGEATSESDPAVIYIFGNIELSDALTVPAGTFVELIGEDEQAGLHAGSGFAEGAQSMARISGGLTLLDMTCDAGNVSGLRIAETAEGGNLTVSGGTVITGGSAVNGRAVLNRGTFRLINGALTQNNAATRADIVCGTVYSEGLFEMTGGVISDNLAVKGGALYNAGGEALITGGILRENVVTGDETNLPYGSYGGAVYNAGSAKLILGAVQITGNQSKQYGGGIANFGELTIDGAVISGNRANLAGGGILTGGTVLMESGTVSGNTLNTAFFANVDAHADRDIRYAASCGGGVYIQAGTFALKDGSISDNQVITRYNESSQRYGEMGNGGGVYVANSAEPVSRFVMLGGVISGNRAKSNYMRGLTMGHGGGVYVLGGESGADGVTPGRFEISGGVIADNRAGETGDEVYVNNSWRQYGPYASGDEDVKYPGVSVMELSGAAVIGGDETDGVFLTDRTALTVTSALAGSVRVSAQTGQEVLIAEQADGYELTESDLQALVNTTEVRKPVLDDGAVFLIPQIDMADICTLTTEDTCLWTGENVRPKVTLTLKDGGKELNPDDYTVEYSKAKSVEPGSYSLWVTGSGEYREYGGSVDASYKIVPVDMSLVTAKLPDQVYTGSAIEYLPANGEIRYGDYALLRNTDYRLSYRNNKALGAATLTLEGIDHFTGTKSVTFRIIPKKAAVKKLVSKKKKNLTVTVRKDAGVTGYQVTVAKDKKFKSGKKTKTAKYASKGYTFTGLTSKKEYYAKVRAYKTISGKKAYGAWSKAKKLKIK